eukprot:18579-Rhodomonas_salina.1
MIIRVLGVPTINSSFSRFTKRVLLTSISTITFSSATYAAIILSIVAARPKILIPTSPTTSSTGSKSSTGRNSYIPSLMYYQYYYVVLLAPGYQYYAVRAEDSDFPRKWPALRAIKPPIRGRVPGTLGYTGTCTGIPGTRDTGTRVLKQRVPRVPGYRFKSGNRQAGFQDRNSCLATPGYPGSQPGYPGTQRTRVPGYPGTPRVPGYALVELISIFLVPGYSQHPSGHRRYPGTGVSVAVGRSRGISWKGLPL